MTSIQAGRITLAREARGYTQAQLAHDTGVSQSYLSKVENLKIAPADDLVDKAAEVLGYPRSFFDAAFAPQSLPISFYRRRLSISAKAVRQIDAISNMWIEHVHQLLVSVDLPEPDVPVVELHGLLNGSNIESEATLRDLPEQVAVELRSAWHVGRGPIENITNLLESHGVVVIPFNFPSPKFDALGVRPGNGVPPLLIVSTAIPGDRLRFTLAHELGHLIMHSRPISPERDIEKEADRFAAEFLAPAAEIKSRLNRLSIQSAAELKAHWKVSMMSLIYRAGQLGKITQHQQEYLYKRMGSLGYRNLEPVPIPREQPLLLRQILRTHLDSLGFTPVELMESLHICNEDFQQWYHDFIDELSRTQLRLI